MTSFQEDSALSAEENAAAQEQAAATFEKAWADAYGGADIKLGDYLKNFQRAYDEQYQFMDGLNQLTASGKLDSGIIQDLAAMGPEANRLVQALVDDLNNNAGQGLDKFSELWGETGQTAALKMATSLAVGQAYISTVMENLGIAGLRSFNEMLSSGMGVEEALAELGFDLNGNPISPTLGDIKNTKSTAENAINEMQDSLDQSKLEAKVTPFRLPAELATTILDMQGQAAVNPVNVSIKPDTTNTNLVGTILGQQVIANQNPIKSPLKADGSNAGTGDVIAGLQSYAAANPVEVKAYVTSSGSGIGSAIANLQWQANQNPIYIPVRSGSAPQMFADGGYTGSGGKWDPRGIVHAGEFVMDAKSTRAIGVGNLYALMRSAQGGRDVTRGYAKGGAVGGSNVTTSTGYTHLAPETIQQIGMVMDKFLIVNGEQGGGR